MPKPTKKVRRGAPAWMLTYGDMTTLLLTFFILMFTTAEIEGRELQLILS
ncbi:MAG: flagellar motor protein MotB, partial [Spirochaetes bacterium]|nr:flagellar motor protein MotB [Spirochaetota bacterium]